MVEGNGMPFELLRVDTEVLEQFAGQIQDGYQPDWLGDYDPRGHLPKEEGKLVTVRHAEHNGHTIEITTTYEITVDGKQFTGHVMVMQDGRLHCHGIPYESYASMVDLMRELVDLYPESFESSHQA